MAQAVDRLWVALAGLGADVDRAQRLPGGKPPDPEAERLERMGRINAAIIILRLHGGDMNMSRAKLLANVTLLYSAEHMRLAEIWASEAPRNRGRSHA
jgi:hypothetical protein